MDKIVSFFFSFFLFFLISAQEENKLSVTVDTTKIRLGEMLNYNIELVTDTVNFVEPSMDILLLSNNTMRFFNFRCPAKLITS